MSDRGGGTLVWVTRPTGGSVKGGVIWGGWAGFGVRGGVTENG